eukprot:CAMPEP_0202920434 /NCGR_PEP_ID=MMETSP1392-20130828/76855_1 /ASSEMBLY_ACC=CAM_ASM_000868 /TAXON_ID=225041 /ORGANISM="Chlamydomonas chlamydogama, Strain SAG 11-48b" /LENGTH=260 /DNA_ID=CAMNT_0049613929 /DNA_START=478 /DNA_END=1264 /DNA_ORIENTATION=-
MWQVWAPARLQQRAALASRHQAPGTTSWMTGTPAALAAAAAGGGSAQQQQHDAAAAVAACLAGQAAGLNLSGKQPNAEVLMHTGIWQLSAVQQLERLSQHAGTTGCAMLMEQDKCVTTGMPGAFGTAPSRVIQVPRLCTHLMCAAVKNGRLDVASTQGLRSDVLQRLNVAIFKAEQAALMLGRAQGAAQALHLARSVVHDVYGLEQLGRKIAAKLKGGIKCEGARSVWEYWWAPTGAVLLWPLAAWARVRLSAPKLEKIY